MSKAFKQWFNTFNEEKGIAADTEIIVNGPSGVNYMTLQNVFDAILSTSDTEQEGIKNMLVKMDFHNANVVDYYKHLAQAIAL